MNFRLTILIPAAFLAAVTMAPAMELKDITFKTANAGKVVFSHNTHLGKKSRTTSNLSCKECHKNGVGKIGRFTMADMEKGKSCGACHNGRKAFTLDHCTECHKVREITFPVKETGPVTFSHTVHLRNLGCSSCHTNLFNNGPTPRVGMAKMEKGKSCGACHNGKGAFPLADCVKCHPVREKTFTVKGAGHVVFSHKFHIGPYTCSDCHPAVFLPGKGNKSVSMAAMETGKSCGVCHDGKSAFTVKENCAKCHKLG